MSREKVAYARRMDNSCTVTTYHPTVDAESADIEVFVACFEGDNGFSPNLVWMAHSSLAGRSQ